ncbi:MAG TPA: invasin domain 3-containing protein [Longimicrobiaceae bacterium]|jgi:hypothetical protein|nr:invasin domain 3-containing protein [Longimicrobiaceae bacterium]
MFSRASRRILLLLAVFAARLAAPLAAQTAAGQPATSPASAATAQSNAAPAIWGDVNGDGQVTLLDALAVIANVVGKQLPAGYTVAGADVDGNGQVSAMDALVIAGYAAGRDMSRYPVGQAIKGTGDGTGGTKIDALDCSVTVATGVMTCRSETPAVGSDNVGAATVGSQGLFVKLTSTNTSFNSGTGIFSADVTVQNLITQTLGTADGTTLDAEGVRVYFHLGPIGVPSGMVTVNNPDGTGNFVSGSNLPFFRYPQLLAQNQTSAAKTWQFHLDPAATTFTFKVYVAAKVKHENGYVDVAPSPDTLQAGGTVQLSASAHTVTGQTTGQPITWSTGDGSKATVSTNGLVTAVADGNVTITATATGEARDPGTASIVVRTPSADSSTITANPTNAAAGDSSLITVQIRSRLGFNITHSVGAGAVVLATTHGTLTSVVDKNNGTYTAYLKDTITRTDTVTGTLNGAAIHDSATVAFGPAAATHFIVEAAGGGAIADQLVNAPFNVKITARDAFENVATGFTGTATLTTLPTNHVSAGSPTAAFTAGVLASQSVTINTTGVDTLVATAGSVVGKSNGFQVQSAPVAVNEAPAPTSVPGQPFHAFYSTASSPRTDTIAPSGVLANDDLGFPLAAITSFGADSLGGTVTTNAAGSTVSPLPGYTSGSLSVASNGSVIFRPADGFTGNYVFHYRITNVRGTSDGQVTIAVGFRPAVADDAYSSVLGNVPINTAKSSQFTVMLNDAGDAKKVKLSTASNGTVTLDSLTGTFAFRPNAGYTGPAGFTYTLTNGFGTTAAATVSFTVTAPVWFVKSDAATNGDGRYDAPFNNLSSAFAAATKPAANQVIFLHSSGTSYTGGVTLLAGQKLIGGGAAGALFENVAGVTWPADAATQPTIGGASPTVLGGLTLGSGNTLRGFNMGGSGTLTGSSFGTLTISELGINTTGQALSLTTGTLAGSFAQVRSTGGTNNVFLSNVATSSLVTLGTASDALSGATADAVVVSGGNGSFTFPAPITNTATLAVNVSGKTGGAVTFSNDINPTTAAKGISVTSNNSGTNTITFSGANQKISSGAAAGVNLTNNTGATISFTGGNLVIASTTGNGFNATGGGTVIVDGATDNSTISSTGGIALNVVSTTIGSGGLNFKSISATGGSNGIVLSATGTTAGLTVAGDGSTAGSGGSITNATGGDGATAGNGVYLNGARNVSLNWMAFSGHQNNGVYGTGVRGFTLNKTRFTGTNGNSNNSGGSFNESDVQLVDVGGPVKLTNSRFDGAAYNAVRIENISGTAPALDSLVLAFDSVGTMQGSTGDVRGTALLVNLMDGTADVRFRNNNVLAWWGNAIHSLIQGTASGTTRITGNFVDNTNGALAGAGGIWVAGGNHAYNISGNTVRHTNGTAISADRVAAGTNMNGTIDNNAIGVSGVANSGSFTGIGIFASQHGPGSTTVKISNNVLRQINGSADGAISLRSGDALAFGGSGTFNATVTGNNIQESGTTVNNAQSGILVTHGMQSGPPNDTDVGCYDVVSNTLANFNTAAVAGRQNLIRVNQRFGTTSRWPGYTGAATGATSQTDIGTYLLSRNTASNSINANTSTGGFLNTSPAGSACAQPSM